MKQSHRLISFALIVASAAAFSVAHAKSLAFFEQDTDWGGVDQPFSIEKARGGTSLNGSLSSADDIDAFAYTFTESVKGFPIQMDVPTCPNQINAAFYPTVALVGPDLPAPEANADLPFVVPEGSGVQTYTIEHARVKRYSYAGYGPEAYVIGLRENVDIPAVGAYMLVVWEPDGNIGPYTLTTGDQEPNFEGMTDTQLNQMWAPSIDNRWITAACATIPTALSATPEVTVAP